MAEADVEISTSWIWLREALRLVYEAVGSLELAKKLLVGWLAAGDVPWSCVSWKGLDAAGIAKLERELREPGPVVFLGGGPPTAYYEGDLRFWAASLAIDWEDNRARELYVIGGAVAQGIKVSRPHVEKRISELVGDPAVPLPIPMEAAKPIVDASSKTWITDEFKQMKEAGELPAGITDCSRVLHARMRDAHRKNPNLRLLAPRSIENGLRDWGLWPPGSTK
jgi:hypothetical protein